VSQDHLDQSVATPQPQSERVPRILDLDLDFFLYGVAGSHVPEDGRLDEDEYPPWPAEEMIEFLEHHLGLDRKLPGVAVEDHVEASPAGGTQLTPAYCARHSMSSRSMRTPTLVTENPARTIF
jgi:hypothetical protein